MPRFTGSSGSAMNSGYEDWPVWDPFALEAGADAAALREDTVEEQETAMIGRNAPRGSQRRVKIIPKIGTKP